MKHLIKVLRKHARMATGTNHTVKIYESLIVNCYYDDILIVNINRYNFAGTRLQNRLKICQIRNIFNYIG